MREGSEAVESFESFLARFLEAGADEVVARRNGR